MHGQQNVKCKKLIAMLLRYWDTGVGEVFV